ncbi:MAG: hypothetical protein ABIH69_06110 [bacterium]
MVAPYLPKLLFHGTAAISVYRSYREAQALKDEKLEGRKLLVNPNHPFHVHGALYPSNINYELEQKLCLADTLPIAFMYAAEWSSAKILDGSIQFINTIGGSFKLSISETDPFSPHLDDLAKLIKRLICYGSSKGHLFPPGAILVLDGKYLADHELLEVLPPSIYYNRDEYARVSYLPWRAIKGCLLVSPYPTKITGFAGRNKGVLYDACQGMRAVFFSEKFFGYLQKSQTNVALQ